MTEPDLVLLQLFNLLNVLRDQVTTSTCAACGMLGTLCVCLLMFTECHLAFILQFIYYVFII